MSFLRKQLIKMASTNVDIKKHYKTYRKVQNILKAPKEPIYKTLDRKIISDNREIPLRVFIPKDNPQAKILLFFHGGGWVTGNIDSYTNVCSHMANKTNHIVISVDYPLAPENPFPAGLNDCYYVAQELFKIPEILNCKKEDITLIGDSAGGNLVAAVSLMARDMGNFLPNKQVLIYPATNYDHSKNSPYRSVVENGTDYLLTSQKVQDYMDLYVKSEEDKLNPYVAPILSTDLSNQPNTLIITAEFDPLRDEGEAYGFKLKRFGNSVKIYRAKGALHGFISNPLSRYNTNKFYEIINEFLNNEEGLN